MEVRLSFNFSKILVNSEFIGEVHFWKSVSNQNVAKTRVILLENKWAKLFINLICSIRILNILKDIVKYLTLSQVATALVKRELFSLAGELFEAVNQAERAMECYRRGEDFRLAVELARKHYPNRVTELEAEWGDQLMRSKQPEAAMSHFIESGKTDKVRIEHFVIFAITSKISRIPTEHIEKDWSI